MTVPKRLRIALILSLAAGAAAAGVILALRLRGPRIVRNPDANILLVTLDTFRADRLGANGGPAGLTPHLDALAREGVVFRNAVSPVPMTLPAHATLLTGLDPPSHGVRTNGKYMLAAGIATLAEAMKAAGYDTAAFVSSFVLDNRFGLGRGFDLYDDRLPGAVKFANLESERRAPETFEAFRTWLEGRAGRKFFSWVHFYDPHFPYDPPEPYRSDPRFASPYDGEIAFTDAAVGEIVRVLKSLGLYDRTLILAAGDHGEAFGEHGEDKGHTFFCYEENLRVPLLFKPAGTRPAGRVVEARVGLADVMPTLLDYAGLPRPAGMRGMSLLAAAAGRRSDAARPLYFESLYAREVLGCVPLVGVTRGGRKYIRLPRPELYDLSSDPREEKNLLPRDAADGRSLEAELERLVRDSARQASEAVRTVSAEEKQRLLSLGYLAGGRRAGEAGSGCDPKDRISFWNRTVRARELAAAGRVSEAEPLLRALIDESPGFAPVLEDLAALYRAEGRTADLAALMDRAVAREPGNAALRIAYGFNLVLAGLPERAIDALRPARDNLDLDERETYFFVLGSALGQTGDAAGAAEAFRLVLEVEPDNYEAERLLGLSLLGLGRYSEALEAFRSAERGLPEHPALLEHTAFCLEQLGDAAGAAAYRARLAAVRR